MTSLTLFFYFKDHFVSDLEDYYWEREELAKSNIPQTFI